MRLNNNRIQPFRCSSCNNIINENLEKCVYCGNSLLPASLPQKFLQKNVMENITDIMPVSRQKYQNVHGLDLGENQILLLLKILLVSLAIINLLSSFQAFLRINKAPLRKDGLFLFVFFLFLVIGLIQGIASLSLVREKRLFRLLTLAFWLEIIFPILVLTVSMIGSSYLGEPFFWSYYDSVFFVLITFFIINPRIITFSPFSRYFVGFMGQYLIMEFKQHSIRNTDDSLVSPSFHADEFEGIFSGIGQSRPFYPFETVFLVSVFVISAAYFMQGSLFVLSLNYELHILLFRENWRAQAGQPIITLNDFIISSLFGAILGLLLHVSAWGLMIFKKWSYYMALILSGFFTFPPLAFLSFLFLGLDVEKFYTGLLYAPLAIFGLFHEIIFFAYLPIGLVCFYLLKLRKSILQMMADKSLRETLSNHD